MTYFAYFFNIEPLVVGIYPPLCFILLRVINQLLYPYQIVKAIQDNKCTGFAGVPSIYISLLKNTKLKEFDLSNLRYITQAGGPLAKEYIHSMNQFLLK